MTSSAGPSRRDFLGLLGLALFDWPPTTLVDAVERDQDSSRPVYLGSVQDLVASPPLEPGWEVSFDALVESVDAPVSEWVLGEVSALILLAQCPLAELPARLRSWGVLRVCEAEYCRETAGMPEGPTLVDVTVFRNASWTTAAWRSFEAAPKEAGLELCEGIGEAAFVSRGGWSVPGKVFFRRGNVLASVAICPPTPGADAQRFADILDRRIVTSGR